MDRSWMSKPKQTAEYSDGVKEFIEYAFTGVTLPDENGNMTILCPCLKCNNVLYQTRKIVETHLMWIGIVQRYTTWIYHGEEDEGSATSRVRRDIDVMRDIVNDAIGVAEVGEFNLDDETPIERPNEDAKRFYRLLEECEKSLYPGCIDYSKMSYIVELLHLKSRYRISNVGIGELMKFFKKCIPSENTAPGSYAEAKKIVSELGLGYEKIDACRNDCVLFYKEHANAQICPVCKESRWEHVDTESDHRREEAGGSARRKRKKVAAKTLRYFPLKPRLRRYFMSEKTAAKMRWHNDGRIKDGVLRHTADTPAWQALDNVQSSFGSEPRNVRLGLATDGFNPFGSGCHSILLYRWLYR